MKNNTQRYQSKIEHLRHEIDLIDTNIINLIANRINIVKEIGKIKNNQNINIIDKVRESHLHTLHNTLAVKYNLDHIFINKLFNIIIKYARKIQKD